MRWRGGSWDVASNWNDTTTGQSPASVAPGGNDSVTINAAGGGATPVISGTGNAASLTLGGATYLTGQLETGTLSLDGSLQLNQGHSPAVSGAATTSYGSTVTADGGELSMGSASLEYTTPSAARSPSPAQGRSGLPLGR